MKSELINTSRLKSNTGQIPGLPKNPRLIKDEKFDKLKKSIQDDPEMLELREVIAYEFNGELVVIAGNMRLKACTELGIKQIPTKILPPTTPIEKLKAYTIKDNVPFGENDWEAIQADWPEAEEWGLDVPKWASGSEFNSMTDEDVDLQEEFDPIGVSAGQQRVVFIFDGSEEAESYLNSLKVQFKKMNMAWQVNMSTRSI